MIVVQRTKRDPLSSTSSGGLTVIEVEQPAEALRFHDRPVLLKQVNVGKRNDIGDPLFRSAW